VRVMFFVASLAAGGAERVVSVLAGEFVTLGHDVAILQIFPKTADHYQVHGRVERLVLSEDPGTGGRMAAVLRNLVLGAGIRARAQAWRPDAVISFGDSNNLLAAVALWGTGIPVVVSERTDPFGTVLHWIKRFVRPAIYRYLADAVHVQTEGLAEKVRASWRVDRVVAVPNPLARGAFAESRCVLQENVFLWVGRLIESKGVDMAIKSFAAIADRLPGWRLRIVGDGPLLATVRSMINEHRLNGRIEMIGVVGDMSLQYGCCPIFVSTSRIEGFPNALLEAAASGCACIAADCEFGPAVLLDGGRAGILVPVGDSQAMSEAMMQLAGSEDLRKGFSRVAEELRYRYDARNIAQRWLFVVRDILAPSARG
jgi:GalNAc-alpha-(1->4)-GalNAc-alpha-(1->3)-diNAcBac-PP-undecaprenol alpha-1,4-N-acetyl-D-galactosaminyltransferase